MKKLWTIFPILISCLLFSSSAAIAEQSRQFSISPRTNNGIKWRLAYYEGGQYDEYYNRLVATVKGLIELGWIAPIELPNLKGKDSQKIWNWLGNNIHSEYIEFVKDAFFSAAWDNDLRQKLKKDIITRFREKKDIDLMFAMGTWAGQDLANNEHMVPTLVISSTDTVESGIIKSVEDSGFDHVHARVDPFRNERQIRIFHEIAGFKKLGVAFENSVAGRSYAAIDTVKAVADKRDFDVVECHTQSDIPDLVVAGESVIKCFEELARQVDAIYVTMQGGVNRDTIPQLVAIANMYRIPTLSQIGEEGVRYGFLLSISSFYASKMSGRFFASTIARVFNGAKPRELPQVLQESPNIAINLKTAEIVGLYLYADILAAADQVFPTIQRPD